MIITFSGVVIRSTNCGESDKIITVLTDEYGKMTVLVKGARKAKSRFSASTGLFSYAEFTVSKTDKYTYLRETDLKESFFDIRRDLASVALAGYMCQVCDDAATEDDSSEMLSLLLNALYVLNKADKSVSHVKAVFEMRMACICGFMPDTEGCSVCDHTLDGEAYLDVMNGAFICSSCKSHLNDGRTSEGSEAYIICYVPRGTATAIRYIVQSEPKRIFSFSLKGQDMACLEQTCEKYLLHHLERGFDALDFYKTVKEE